MPRLRVGELELAVETDGAGEPLLMLMGLGGDRQGWDLVRADLARRHRLVLLDNRDAGESDEARGPYGLGEMAADALDAELVQHTERVASLVLACTWGRTDGFLASIFNGWRLQVERLSAEEFLAAQMPWAFTYRAFHEPPPALLAFQEARRARGALLRSVAAYQRQVDACLAHDTLALLALLRTPTLALVGEDDILTPPRYARAVAASLTGSEVLMLPATAHACFLETPKPFADRVLRFLTRHPLST